MSEKKKFVLIEDIDNTMFCTGIFSDRRTAIGAAMESMWEYKDNYQKEGDVFECSDFEEMDGESGIMMTITFKAACWERVIKGYYYILDA